MPFAFSQVEPRQTGRVSSVPVPLADYLGAAFDQGLADSSFASVYKYNELGIEKTGQSLGGLLKWDVGEKLLPDELNRRFGIKGYLQFNEPEYEGAAGLIQDRKKKQMNRDFLLQNGDTGAGRFAAGLGTQLLSSMLNPIDFGLMFLPVTGSAELAEKAAVLGRGAIRQGIASGAITMEALEAAVPAHKFVASVINGVAGQAVAEIPFFMSKTQQGDVYTLNDSAFNILVGGAFAGGLHLGITAASKIFSKLRPETHETMLHKAVDDFVKGEEFQVHNYVQIDENWIKEHVKFDEDAARRSALGQLSEDDIRAYTKQVYKEGVRNAAIEGPDGKIYEAQMHFMIPESENIGEPGWTRGAVTDKGRFVPEQEVEYYAGIKTDIRTTNDGTKYKVGWGSEDQHFDMLPGESKEDFVNNLYNESEKSIARDVFEEGGNVADAINAIRQNREKVSDEFFYSRPDTEKLIDRERERRVQSFIEQERAKFDPESEISKVRQSIIEQEIKDGKILTLEQKKLWSVPDDTSKASDTQFTESIKSLEEQLKDDPEFQALKEAEKAEKKGATQASDPIMKFLDDSIKALQNDPSKLMMDPFLLETLGKPLLRGLLQVIREAYTAGKDLAKAVEAGMEWLKKEGKGNEEGIRAALEKELKGKKPAFMYSIESELAKEQPFNLASDRFTPQLIAKKLQQLPGAEQAMLKLAGIDEFLKGKEKVTPEELRDWVEKNKLAITVKPMLNVTGGDQIINKIREYQHLLETAGYKIDPDGVIISKPSKVTKITKDTEKWYSEELLKAKDLSINPEDQLIGDFVSQNVSVPIAFEKMEKPRTIFLAAPQKVHVGSSHYEGVFPKGKKNPNMLAWMETHVVTMPDGRKVLHVFEVQSDVKQSFYVDNEIASRPGAVTSHYLSESGANRTKTFFTQKEAQSFVDQKLKEYQEKVQPLIKSTDEILLKSAIDLAHKEGLDGVVISDPRTAMLTQGHLGTLGGPGHDGPGELTYHNVTGEPLKEGESAYFPPSQAGGMTQAYGNTLPNMLKKFTGKEGEKVDMGGKHYFMDDLNDDVSFGEGEVDKTTGELPHFNKAFPGSDSPSGTMFPVKHLDPEARFEAFTPKREKPNMEKAIKQSIDCIIQNLI